MTCPDCKHEEHPTGNCGSCNCGESEQVQSLSSSRDMTDGRFSFSGKLNEFVSHDGYRTPVIRYD